MTIEPQHPAVEQPRDTLLQILVVDDEALARQRLATLLADCREPKACCAAQAAHAEQALTLLKAQHFDAILLDIHMPGTDGLALAEQLRAMPTAPPPIIFVTAHTEHALKAFELEALDYLTKPVRLQRLQAALERVQRLRQRAPVHPSAPGQLTPAEAPEEAVLVIQDRLRTERVPLSSVVYVKAELKYLTVRTVQRSFILDGALAELETRHAEIFLRVHRNALVARRSARALERHHDPIEGDGWVLRLEGVPERLPVSRRQLAAVRQELAR